MQVAIIEHISIPQDETVIKVVLANVNSAASFLFKFVAKNIREQEHLLFIQNENFRCLIIFSTLFNTTAFAHCGGSNRTASIFPVLYSKQIIDQYSSRSAYVLANKILFTFLIYTNFIIY